jgi:polyhydroxyalkanoate synthesis regulator phasin
MSPSTAPIPNNSRPIWELVIEDMQARDEFGWAKYKTPLQAGNGRDSLQDAYEECLDLCVYLRKEIEERKLRIEQLEKRIAHLKNDQRLPPHDDSE